MREFTWKNTKIEEWLLYNYDKLNLPNHGLPSRTDEKLQGDHSSTSLKPCSQ